MDHRPFSRIDPRILESTRRRVHRRRVVDTRGKRKSGKPPEGIISPRSFALGNRRAVVRGVRSTARAAQIRQYVLVFFGAHLVLYSHDAEADRQFLAETLGLGSVDAGHGWLIFAMPPSEVAVHPAESAGAELYLMCEDLASEIESLAARGVSCSAIEEARWGSITKIALPGGGKIGLYQPRHPVAIDRGK